MDSKKRRTSLAIQIDEQSGNITDETRQEIKEAFQVFDKDNDGQISTGEIKEVLRLLGIELPGNVLDDILKELDANGDGVLDYEEFESFLMNSKNLQTSSYDEADETMMDAFKMLDKDNDGFISRAELVEFLKDFGGQNKTDSEIDDIIREADTNGDGSIDFKEFSKHMIHNL